MGAVELLGEERADEHVGPGHGAEGEDVVGAGEDGGVQAFGAADEETGNAGGGEPVGKEVGKAFAAGAWGAGVEGYDEGCGRQGSEEGLGFSALDFGRGAAAIGEVGDREGGAQPGVVAVEEVALGTGFVLADCDQAHGAIKRMAGRGRGWHRRSEG